MNTEWKLFIKEFTMHSNIVQRPYMMTQNYEEATCVDIDISIKNRYYSPLEQVSFQFTYLHLYSFIRLANPCEHRLIFYPAYIELSFDI